jgi:hypothetical protein
MSPPPTDRSKHRWLSERPDHRGRPTGTCVVRAGAWNRAAFEPCVRLGLIQVSTPCGQNSLRSNPSSIALFDLSRPSLSSSDSRPALPQTAGTFSPRSYNCGRNCRLFSGSPECGRPRPSDIQSCYAVKWNRGTRAYPDGRWTSGCRISEPRSVFGYADR